MQGYTIYLFP